MAAKKKYVEIIQAPNNASVQQIWFIPGNINIGTFCLSKKASTSMNADLIKKLGAAYESYFSSMLP